METRTILYKILSILVAVNQNELKMKVVKIITVVLVIVTVFYVIFNKSKEISIEGRWNATNLVFDGKDLIASQAINRYFKIDNEATFNYWSDSLSISTVEHGTFIAKFGLEKDIENNYIMRLSSNEKSLNGVFKMKLDTTHIGPQAYIVDLKIFLDKTILCFQREVIIPSWKPEAPREGQV